jgi:hypothetical protein
VGQGESKIVLGKHSGRHAFADTLKKMGYDLSGDALNQVFTRFKELADRKVELSDADLEALVAEEVGDTVRYAFSLVAINVVVPVPIVAALQHLAAGIVLAFVIGGVAGLALAARKRRIRGLTVPFGPFMLAGVALTATAMTLGMGV